MTNREEPFPIVWVRNQYPQQLGRVSNRPGTQYMGNIEECLGSMELQMMGIRP